MTFGRRGPYLRRAGGVLLAAGVLMHAVLAGSAILFLGGVIPQWALLVAQPAVIAVGLVVVGCCDRALRRPDSR